MKKLTKKQVAFRDAILSGFNPSEAYRKAFEAKEMSAKAISVEAARLLKHKKIALAITLAVRNGHPPALAPAPSPTVALSMQRRLDELQYAATLDPAECFNEHGQHITLREMPEHVRRAIAGYEVDPVSFVTKVRFIDKLAAITTYSKLCGDIPISKPQSPAAPAPRWDTSSWTNDDWEAFKRLREKAKARVMEATPHER